MTWDRAPVDVARLGKTARPEGEGRREISFREALKEALVQAMQADERVFIIGEGVDDIAGSFGTTLGLHEMFGRGRVIDTALAENGITGVAAGAAMAGMRPVMVHLRMDFLPLAMDQIINHAAKWYYMFGGRVNVPLTIRAIIGGGWGSAAQHSQSLQALFMHIPGLKVVMPSTPYDAKGLLLAAIADGNPVICIEHRWLYDRTGPVPREMYTIPIGQGDIVREGRDATVVATSYMAFQAALAAASLEKEGIDIEVIDPRSLKPLNETLILASVRKTGRLVTADTGWRTGGAGAEIAARVIEHAPVCLKAPIRRVSCPDTPTPASAALEKVFYPGQADIIAAVKEVLAYR
jgi:pyruvate dehydrogenase E1 component beta subunit